MDRTETPDLGKVIEGLRCCTEVGGVQFCVDEGCPYALVPDDCMNVLMSDALALLREREPVKPIDENYRKHTMGRCGHCKAPLPAIEGFRSKFCWMCGGAVKWDDS